MTILEHCLSTIDLAIKYPTNAITNGYQKKMMKLSDWDYQSNMQEILENQHGIFDLGYAINYISPSNNDGWCFLRLQTKKSLSMMKPNTNYEFKIIFYANQIINNTILSISVTLDATQVLRIGYLIKKGITATKLPFRMPNTINDTACEIMLRVGTTPIENNKANFTIQDKVAILYAVVQEV